MEMLFVAAQGWQHQQVCMTKGRCAGTCYCLSSRARSSTDSWQRKNSESEKFLRVE